MSTLLKKDKTLVRRRFVKLNNISKDVTTPHKHNYVFLENDGIKSTLILGYIVSLVVVSRSRL